MVFPCVKVLKPVKIYDPQSRNHMGNIHPWNVWGNIPTMKQNNKGVDCSYLVMTMLCTMIMLHTVKLLSNIAIQKCQNIFVQCVMNGGQQIHHVKHHWCVSEPYHHHWVYKHKVSKGNCFCLQVNHQWQCTCLLRSCCVPDFNWTQNSKSKTVCCVSL